MNILEEVQIYVADRLNADSQLSGLCPFIFENKRDIDYEIKSALGKQGIIGLVMTPKATFAGAFEDKSLAWQVDELEVDIIENVTVNRGKKNGFITGQDAAMRLFDVLCPLTGENEGQFNAVSYEEGEDGGLLVNRCILKCLVHHFEEPVPPDPRKTRLTYDDGRVVELALSGTIYQGHLPDLGHIVAADIGEDVTLIGESAFNLCYELTSVTLPSTSIGIGPFAFNETPLTSLDFEDSGLTEIGMAAFEHCERMTSVSLPSTLSSIGQGAFVYCSNLDVVNFAGKTLYEISNMANYPWGIVDTKNIHNIIGPDTRVKYGWSQSWDSLPLSGTLNSDDLPSRDGISYIGIGSSIDEIGYRAFRGIEFLTGVEIPDTVTTIGTEAFAGVEGMTDIEIPSSVSSIGSNAFFGCHLLSSVMFQGKTLEQVQAMQYYPWGITDTSII